MTNDSHAPNCRDLLCNAAAGAAADENQLLTVGANMLAAAGAGAATIISTNPFWVVKIRLQTQGMRAGVVPYKSTLSALSRIAHEEGIRGLYSGLIPALAAIGHVAIFPPTFEKIKFYLADQEETILDKLSARDVAVATLQEEGHHFKKRYSGVVVCIKKVFQQEGVPGFYRRCTINPIQTTPAAIITFTGFEMIHRFLINLSPNDPQPHAL
ncbi:Nicotinamide adenine dinucleotide transporter 1 [Hibiscus syriacus]|uniref:Nicotinamide adenine dinucleotide transporter 1 n=1 Tax=Hibiscus syriacus TaxID=106335 RepID=A0A6A2ZQL2_HIBSY|nr:Nicotinamide adenine dinucleotide transporter 1 [Hibiscus syriacus]